MAIKTSDTTFGNHTLLISSRDESVWLGLSTLGIVRHTCRHEPLCRPSVSVSRRWTRHGLPYASTPTGILVLGVTNEPAPISDPHQSQPSSQLRQYLQDNPTRASMQRPSGRLSPGPPVWLPVSVKREAPTCLGYCSRHQFSSSVHRRVLRFETRPRTFPQWTPYR